MLKINDIKKKLPFNVNYGMADISIRHILDPKWNIQIDWDVYLPTIGMNLQRPFVWTLQQKQELIKSVCKGIQLFPISVLQKRDEDRRNGVITYQIIDGKQRLSTIISFCKNEFPFIWEENEYYFKDLDEYLQNDFLTGGCIKSNIGYDYASTPISDKHKIMWFELINFSGTQQDEEHMKKLKTKNETTSS